MSTEIGKVWDVLLPGKGIAVLTGTGGVGLLSSEKKIWLNEYGIKKLIGLLATAYYAHLGVPFPFEEVL